jgi:hypothetical protein
MACGGKKVELWDATTVEQLLTLKGHADQINDAAF